MAKFFLPVLLIASTSATFALTKEEQDALLNAHNSLRADLANGRAVNDDNTTLPAGKNIYKLNIDPTIEAMAQKYADKCVFEHSSQKERNGTGENLYMGGKQSYKDVLVDASNLWWSELKENGFHNPDLILTQEEWDNGIGHWSQMAWAQTKLIGCGVTYCENQGTIVVCNYSPAGNYIDSPVYEKGSPCKQATECTTVPDSKCDSSGLCCDPANLQCSSA
ncbi:cysteine-rich secretory protein family domain-containing protein [Ditylenchus destructor]|uniref:Cysteine-rich secretory protein family domain-containing protein n=1 Tax=Ditylenchus destructor TaxID=166010 RepID=A0AAD4ME56_9BILA|nr:cysteine-rich secretory protein family domain-containing protein [Ditylenchus destructor]